MPITYTNNIRSFEGLPGGKVCLRYDLVGDDGAGNKFSVARALDVPYTQAVSTLTPDAANILIAAADTAEAATKAPNATWRAAQQAVIERELSALATPPAVVSFDAPAPVPSPPVPLSPEDQKALLKAYAASKRFRVETGGTTFNGMPIWTDRGTQNAIDRTVNALQLGIAAAPVGWKTSSGWVDLDLPTLAAIGGAVAKHVQSAFAIERALSDQIDGGAVTTTDQIDAAGWPANS